MTAPSYVHGTSAVPLLGETIGENLRRTVERFPEREALVVVHQGYRATYRQLWEQIGLVAAGLLARGVKKGDRVGIWSPNRHEWVLVQYATARIGAILVNVNPAYRSHELEHVLKQSGTSLLVIAKSFRQADYVAMVRDAQPPQHPQQRLLHRRDAALHRARSRLHPRAALPLLRHGPREPRHHHPRRVHGLPGRELRAGSGAGDGGEGALHRALRRPH